MDGAVFLLIEEDINNYLIKNKKDQALSAEMRFSMLEIGKCKILMFGTQLGSCGDGNVVDKLRFAGMKICFLLQRLSSAEGI